MLANDIDRIIELPEDPLGGTAGAKLFHVLFAGKTYSEKFPHIVFNEKVAGEIGRMLGLCCPEVLIEPFDDRWYFFSRWQETTRQGTVLPPGSASDINAFFQRNPEYVHGMIVFDLYVGNNDRRRDNIVLRNDGRLALIDHGNALLSYRSSNSSVPSGLERLEGLESDLRTMFGKPHQFLKALTDIAYVEFWTERIRQIPDFFIESLIQNLPEMEYINPEMKKRTVAFLLDRRAYIFNHIMKHRELFPNLKEEG